MRTAWASSLRRLEASLLAVMLCAVLVQPAHAITSSNHFMSAVPVTEKTAYTAVFEGGAQAYTGLFVEDNPVYGIDPSGHDELADVLIVGDVLGSLDSFVNNAQLVYKQAMGVAYRQRAINLLTTVIRPTLDSIQSESGTKVAGENAEYMLLGTAIAETGDLNTRKQKNGPALGLYQMEPFTHDDLWNNYLPIFKPKLRDAVLKHFNITQMPNAQLLEGDDAYATIMARIRYLPAPAIPSATDLNGQAQYWVQWYNRGGKGTVADYLARWHKAMGM